MDHIIRHLFSLSHPGRYTLTHTNTLFLNSKHPLLVCQGVEIIHTLASFETTKLAQFQSHWCPMVLSAYHQQLVTTKCKTKFKFLAQDEELIVANGGKTCGFW